VGAEKRPAAKPRKVAVAAVAEKAEGGE